MGVAEWIMENGESLQVLLLVPLFVLLIGLERVFPRRTGEMDRKSRWPTNLILTAVNLASLGIVPVTLLGSALWADARHWGLLNTMSAPVPVLVGVSLLARGFISFFTHYLMHMVPALWRLHRVHHLDTELDVSSTVRGHPLEFFVNGLIGAPVVVLLGLSPWVLMLYELLDVAVVFWSHSNVRLPVRIDRVLRYIVVTPDLHRVHHSAWRPETNSNFSAVFPIWDVVFGTFRATPRDGHEYMRIGLDDVRGKEAHRPLWLLASPLRRRLHVSVPARAEHDDTVLASERTDRPTVTVSRHGQAR